MKRFRLMLICTLVFQMAIGQSMDMKDITSFLDLGQGKLETHLQKKGYKRNLFAENGDLGACYTREEKGKRKNIRSFEITSKENGYELTYRTTCYQEDSLLNK